MTTTKIYLDLSPEIEQLLDDNNLTIQDILRIKNIDAEVAYDVLPYQLEEGVTEKKVVPIIIASSAAVLATGYAVSEVIDSINERPYLVEYCEHQEVKDNQGTVLLDQNGKPALKCNSKVELLQPRAENKDREIEITWDLKNGITIKVKSIQNQHE